MSGNKIPIKEVMDLPLWTMLFTMQRVVGIEGAHQYSWEHMLYSLEAMAHTVFNWAEALFTMFKDHLTECQQGEMKQFGYGNILACFIFKRVPLLRPQVVFTELRARDPRMLQWVEIIS